MSDAPSSAVRLPTRPPAKTALFILFVMTLVCLPSAILGEEFVLPNPIVATIYSVEADDSFATAAIAFLATLVASFAGWRWAPPRGASNDFP